MSDTDTDSEKRTNDTETPTADPTPLLSADAVSRTFGGVSVVSGVSLDVPAGVTGVVGPNGSGKSTLVRLLAGDLDPTGGEVRYRGPDTGRPIGYLPQRAAFRDSFTARETLAFYARLAGGDPGAVDAALDRVGIGDAGDRRVGALSGGMRRLLGIAQATVGDPRVILLDEPASGLDPTMRERAFDVVSDLAGPGTAVLVTSHALDLVDRHADRLALLDRGELVAAGRRSRLLAGADAADVSALYATVVGSGRAEVHVTGVTE